MQVDKNRLWTWLRGRPSARRYIIKQHDITDCGAACIASLAGWFGLQLPIARIRQYAATDKKGTSLLGLVEAATQLGFSAKAVRAPLESVGELPCPAILHVVIDKKLQHYVVLYGSTPEGVRIMDPAKGTLETMSKAKIGEMWTGVALLLAPAADFQPGNEKVSVTERFMALLQPHKGMLVQIVLGAMVYTVLGLCTSIYLQKIIDYVLPDGNRNLLNLMSILMIFIVLAQIFINYTKTILTIKTGQQIDARLILGYYKHLLKLPQSFFDSMRVGEIISRMNDAVKIRMFVNDVLINLAVNIFILFFSFALMFTAYWKLALIMLTVVPLYGVAYYISNKLNRRTQRKLMENTAELEAQLVESVQAIGTIKRFGLEDYANVKTEGKFVKLLHSVYRSGSNALLTGSGTSIISGLFTIVLLWVGSSFVLDNSLTAGELLSFYALMGYFTGPVVSLIGMNKVMQDALIAADRLFEIMDLDTETPPNTTVLTRDMMGDIELRGVHFRYGTRVTVFDGLDLQIPRGKITAIVGESGSGKTTLLSLLQNIYPLQAGNITINGLDLKYVDINSLRTLVSVVPQKIDLFAGTVMETHRHRRLYTRCKKVVAICRKLGILNFIESLPNGFDAWLGENGANLSGGQRQRTAIARALYRDPEVLILDEATSSLDSLSEVSIQEAVAELREAGKTVLIIAHRLSTVMNADKIVVMHQGKILEEGLHDELLTLDGAYARMWEQQFPAMRKKVTRKRKSAE
ncbi:peptidase domain-containing ABC transporter [Chitinophaga sedimenti]|uniref:peptidase domain-containing ABC transporter n=1 Tax=Chitinophaga sedimenti TaxID=2033606 RepID=UPI002003A688|nr:peptidase domain-containing ABC transporter [Chitinophaga sedimenti]MCK7556460.1 peptidase domain-containing ABC transporter [Chitinophaga sedimenti]